MPEVTRWGVIGSGGIARRRTIPEGIVPSHRARLVSVFDMDLSVNQAVAQQFNVQACDSLDELLATDIDAAYVASPAGAHHEQVLACAQAGKHVLCEKPLGLTVAETEAMIKACEHAQVRIGTAFMMRFQSQHQAALERIEKGQLGRLVFGRAQLSCWYPPITGAWRQDPSTGGGGALMDMGGHCIDLLEMFLGNVAKVSCMINNTVHEYPSEDSAVATLFFENGALAVVDTFFCIRDSASKNALELHGTGGSILAAGTIGQGEAGTMTAYLEDPHAAYDAQQQRDASGGIPITPPPANMYRAEVEEFGDAIREGREPSNSARLGQRSQAILNACYESARTGRVVEVL
jgi:predicted dehydrogenase